MQPWLIEVHIVIIECRSVCVTVGVGVRCTAATLMIRGTRTMRGWKRSPTTFTTRPGNMSGSYDFTPVTVCCASIFVLFS